ncbi:MAG: Wzz/FepE/Etk N-terminal domain-containing protein [Gammaproteobacteria bacterium]|jgi:uncharacterized protein involved in exopolysaccharide biosynthesis
MKDIDRMPFGIEEEVDLLQYLYVILRFKYRILIVAMLGAVAVFAYSKLVDDIYMSTAVVAVNIKEKPGGVSPKEYRASDALGLIEHDFIIDAAHSNERDRLMARMRSMKFSQLFIEENNLLPYIFHKRWNSEAKKWEEGFKPDLRQAGRVFSESMRGLESDDQSGLLRVHFKTRDPELSAKLANNFVIRFNQYIRDNQAEELKARRSYLEDRLSEVENIELHRSIYRLMETQLAAESLLYARSEYPLEVIQPAFAPIYKSYPSRKKWAALTFVGLVLLGVMVSIGTVLLKNLRQGLKDYQEKNAALSASEELKQLDDKQPDKDQKDADPKATPKYAKYDGDDWVD